MEQPVFLPPPEGNRLRLHWRPKQGGKETQGSQGPRLSPVVKYVLNRLDSACKTHMTMAHEEQAPVPTQGFGAQFCSTPNTLDSDRGATPLLLPADTEHEESFSFSTQEQPVCAEGTASVNKWLSRSRRKTTPRKTALAFVKAESPVGLSGPKFFPASLLDDSDMTQTPATCTASVGTRLPSGHTGQKTRKKHALVEPRIRKQAKLWHKLEVQLDGQHAISAEAEETIIELAEQAPQNEGLLEHWTLEQLFSCASRGPSVGVSPLRMALKDVQQQLSLPSKEPLQIRSSNVTSWRAEIVTWLDQLKEPVVCLQETHLIGDSRESAARKAARCGYELHGGSGSPGQGKGVLGGTGILVCKHWQARFLNHVSFEGGGFTAVVVRTRQAEIACFSVYLRSGVAYDSHPNAEILSRLMANIKAHSGHWFAIGDWNVAPEELLASNILSELQAYPIVTGQATCDSGNELDYCICSSKLRSISSIAADWTAPHRPHSSLILTCDTMGGQCKVFQLPAYGPVGEVAGCSRKMPCITHIKWMGREISDEVSLAFAALAQECSATVCPEETAVRGITLSLKHGRLMAPSKVYQYTDNHAKWQRLQVWANKTPQKIIKAEELEHLLSGLTDSEAQEINGDKQAKVKSLLAGEDDIDTRKWIEDEASRALKEHVRCDKERYKEWLDGAVQKGMRPLFRAMKSHESGLERPFQTMEPMLRPYCRLAQWQPIWQGEFEPVPTVFPLLRAEAKREAELLPPLDPLAIMLRIKRLPLKAPGPDGWTIPFLKALPEKRVEDVTQFFHLVEKTGQAPHQWCTTQVTMLVKSVEIERPIALCHVAYKLWTQARYNLVAEWMARFELVAPWDAARPGQACLDISVRRVFLSEISRSRGLSRVSVFIDLTTFYETVEHELLIQQAKILGFPQVVLNIALQIYRGERLISSEGRVSHPIWASRGIMAGCPIAPALAKLALFPTCQKVYQSNQIQSMDVWLDDISVDVEHREPQAAARQALAVFRMLQLELGAARLQLSIRKSAFVCSDGSAEKELRIRRKVKEPQVQSLVKDLGADSSGGRRRRVKTSNSRIQKAVKRSAKLHRLGLGQKKHAIRAFKTSAFTAGTWGHQAQGLSPKRMKVVRGMAVSHSTRLALGSADVVFDMGEFNVQDPVIRIVLEHWDSLSRCVAINGPCAPRIQQAWGVTWKRLARAAHPWRLAAGPIAAMVCYLRDMGFEAPAMEVWSRPDLTIRLEWGNARTAQQVKEQLRGAMLRDRWGRIASQHGGGGAEQGLDWTTHRSLLKKAKGNTLKVTGLRMVWQGAVAFNGHGGHAVCTRCGGANSFVHALHTCPAWAAHDIGPDPEWRSRVDAPECFWLRGLVPAPLTKHPDHPPSLLETR